MPLIILTAGVVAIVALIGWALTRTVEPEIATTPPAQDGTFATATAPSTGAQSTTAAQSTATTDTHAAEHAEESKVARITVEELKQKLARNEVTIIDVRDATSYQNGHIPGSLLVPFARVEGEAANLPKSKPIVTYCT